MKIGPNQRSPGELKDQLLDARRAYKEGKEKLIDESITYTESSTNKWFALLFVGLLLAGWATAVLWELSIAKIFDTFKFLPIIVYFFISYFAFFHISKLIFTPSDDESADDTSYIALFSACEARERRGLLSTALGIANTIALLSYVVVKQIGSDVWHLF